MASQDSQPFHWSYAEFDDHNFHARGHTLLFYAFVLFAVVLLAALLFLYARWLCRCDSSPPEASHGTTANAPVPGLPLGLNAAAIDKLPIVLHGGVASGAEEAGECSICLGEFEEGEKLKALPQCGHCYHGACVDRWLVTRSVCPLCRAPLRVDSAGP